MKTFVQRIPFKCAKCGGCCSNTVGDSFGMALTPEENARLHVVAKRKGLKFDTLPLTRSVGRTVTLFQMTQKRCPFLDYRNKCMIYAQRPTVCRMYPVHPYYIDQSCRFVETTKKILNSVGVIYPPETSRASKFFAYWIQPDIDNAVEYYDLDRGWVKSNKKREVRQVFNLESE